MNDRFLGNTRYTNQILKLDQAYVHSLCLNYFGDSYVERVHRVLSTPYVKPEFVCDLCGAGNAKRGNRPAAFFPTQVGYIYTCLKCNPGITGWAQVNGLRGPTNKEGSMDKRFQHDLYYIKNWNLMLDIYILIRTVFVVLFQRVD